MLKWPHLFFVTYELSNVEIHQNLGTVFFALTILSLPTSRDDNVKSHPIFQKTRRTNFHCTCRQWEILRYLTQKQLVYDPMSYNNF